MKILQILLGLFLLSFGLYGIFANWWLVEDYAGILIPLCLVLFGVISILAGISGIKEKKAKFLALSLKV